MMFDVVRSSKQCGSGYINTVRCLPTKSCACLACLAYHNKQTVSLGQIVAALGHIVAMLEYICSEPFARSAHLLDGPGPFTRRPLEYMGQARLLDERTIE